MLNVKEFYKNKNRPHNMDYRQYVFLCLDNAKEQLGTEDLLEALALCLSTEDLASNLEYIGRNYEIKMEEYDKE